MATCSYNGVSFVSFYRSSIKSRPIADEPGRTTALVEHALEIEAFVTATAGTGDGTDTTMEGLRKRLTARCGELTYEDKGFGSLTVNAATGARDVAYGPVPEMLDWQPLGGEGQAARVRWKVTTRIPECDNARYVGWIMEASYDVRREVDEDNYTTITTKGFIVIPMTRRSVNDRKPPDCVDLYRKKIESECPLGFRRKAVYDLTPDKRRLNFVVTDTEIPMSPPEKVSKIEADETVETIKAYAQWSVRINATITMARGHQRGLALETFLMLLNNRLRKVLFARVGGERIMLPGKLRISESIYGRASSFSFSCMVTEGRGVKTFLENSGLWSPHGNFATWRATMKAVRQTTPDGYAIATVLPGDDVIMDLCDAREPILAAPVVTPAPAENGDGPPITPGPVQGTIPFKIKPDNSWVDFETFWMWEEVSNLIRHKLLPEDTTDAIIFSGAGRAGSTIPIKPTGAPDAAGSAAAIRSAVGAPVPAGNQGTMPADTFQRAASPTRTMVLVGQAVRVGYRVAVPALTTVGGLSVVELHREVQEMTVTSFLPVLLHAATWRITYGLAEAPRGNLPTLGNPVTRADGGAGTGKGD